MERRGFLGAILGTCIAPAIVHSSSLMKIIVPYQKIYRLTPAVSSPIWTEIARLHAEDVEKALLFGMDYYFNRDSKILLPSFYTDPI